MVLLILPNAKGGPFKAAFFFLPYRHTLIDGRILRRVLRPFIQVARVLFQRLKTRDVIVINLFTPETLQTNFADGNGWNGTH